MCSTKCQSSHQYLIQRCTDTRIYCPRPECRPKRLGQAYRTRRPVASAVIHSFMDTANGKLGTKNVVAKCITSGFQQMVMRCSTAVHGSCHVLQRTRIRTVLMHSPVYKYAPGRTRPLTLTDARDCIGHLCAQSILDPRWSSSIFLSLGPIRRGFFIERIGYYHRH